MGSERRKRTHSHTLLTTLASLPFMNSKRVTSKIGDKKVTILFNIRLMHNFIGSRVIDELDGV